MLEKSKEKIENRVRGYVWELELLGLQILFVGFSKSKLYNQIVCG